MKTVWKTIINVKSSNDVPINSLLIGETITTNAKLIANHFNTFFTSVAAKLNEKIVKSKKPFSHYLGQTTDETIFLSPTTPADIESLINCIKPNRAIGTNSIPTKILNEFKTEVSEPLSDMINVSFSKGIFPDFQKVANVIPIHKKGEKLEPNNYRPISLLSNISKLYKKAMHIRLTNFLRKNKVLFPYQFGFRNNHSTDHALISLTEMIRNALDNGNFACGVFIDLQKAFDNVNHDILLSKLNHYGIRGVAFNWFKSYLRDRTQYATINNERSKIQTIKYGVPQGSILGPLLFLIYINDLSRSIINSKIHHFADDTNLLYVSSSLKDINKKINFDLSNLVQWLRANKIALNVNKTDIAIFRSPRKQITKKMNFPLSGQKIRQKTCTKYLGVLLDEHVLFKDHINTLKQKLNRASGILAKLRHDLSFDILKTVYYSLFDTHLHYASQVWG